MQIKFILFSIVAGYNAADTRNAAQVLANYEDYSSARSSKTASAPERKVPSELEGKEEVVISGTQIKAAEVVEAQSSETASAPERKVPSETVEEVVEEEVVAEE